MRKTSQDGGDSSSITSGVENEVRKSAAGVVKSKKSSIKRNIQSFSHESDDGVVEPLLQKEKPESMIQSAKYLLSKTKTDIKSDKIDDKDKLLSEGKFKKSPAASVTDSINGANVTKESNCQSSSSQLEKMPSAVHNYINTNVFCTSDGFKNSVTTKSQNLVEIDGSKPNSYNSSSLIFTTAKIHSDGNTKHMEPVQMTPVPILCTAEGSIGKANTISESQTIDIGKSVSSEYKILDTDDLKNFDSLKMISNSPAKSIVQPVLTSTFSKNTFHSESDKFRKKDIPTSKLSQTTSSSSKNHDSEIKHETTSPSKIDSQSCQTVLRSEEQKCQYSNKQTFNGNADVNKNLQSNSGELKSQDNGISALNIKETVKVANKDDNIYKESSKDLNAQKNTLEVTKDTAKMKTICSPSNTTVQIVTINSKPVLGTEKQNAHTTDISETSSLLTKKASVSILTPSDKPVAKGSVIELPIKTTKPEIVQAKVDSIDTFKTKSSDVNKKNELSGKHSNLSDAASTTSTKTISKPKMTDLAPIKGNTKSSEKSSQNDKGAMNSKHITKNINNQSVDITKSSTVSNATSIKVPITVSKAITLPASQNTVNVMSSTSKRISSNKPSGNAAKITVTASNLSGSSNNIKTTSTVSQPGTSATATAKEAIATTSKTSQQDIIKPANVAVKPSSIKTKLQPTVTLPSKNITSATKSSITPVTTMSTTDFKSKPTTKSSQHSKEVKNDKVK